MEKFERSWQIMRASWDVLRQDKEILVFPMISGIALMLILASFVVPIFALGGIDTVQRVARHNGTVGNLVVLFAFYFINYFVVIMWFSVCSENTRRAARGEKRIAKMTESYFIRVTRQSPTEFWINNPTREHADPAISHAATGCTNNPSYTQKMIDHPSESAYALRILDETLHECRR